MLVLLFNKISFGNFPNRSNHKESEAGIASASQKHD